MGSPAPQNSILSQGCIYLQHIKEAQFVLDKAEKLVFIHYLQ